jgi:hypothetical protein
MEFLFLCIGKKETWAQHLLSYPKFALKQTSVQSISGALKSSIWENLIYKPYKSIPIFRESVSKAKSFDKTIKLQT